MNKSRDMGERHVWGMTQHPSPEQAESRLTSPCSHRASSNASESGLKAPSLHRRDSAESGREARIQINKVFKGGNVQLARIINTLNL